MSISLCLSVIRFITDIVYQLLGSYYVYQLFGLLVILGSYYVYQLLGLLVILGSYYVYQLLGLLVILGLSVIFIIGL